MALLTVLRRELLEPPYSDCRSRSEANPGEEGDQVDDRGLEYAGVASSTRADRSRGIMPFVEPEGGFGLRGPPGRWRKGAPWPVEKLEGERTRVNSMVRGVSGGWWAMPCRTYADMRVGGEDGGEGVQGLML